jgi:hypothetical protein
VRFTSSSREVGDDHLRERGHEWRETFFPPGAATTADFLPLVDRYRRRAAEAWRTDRERRESLEAERERPQREAKRRERQAAHERELGKDLVAVSERWNQAIMIREFLRAVRDRVEEPRSEGFAAWLSWADSFVETLDPLRDKAAIAKLLRPQDDEPGVDGIRGPG